MSEYIVTSNLIGSYESLAPYREDHLNYLTRLKNSGNLQMGGRFTDGKGGLYIVIAGSDEEAEALVKGDPYHVNNLREFTIRQWERKI